MTFYFSDNETFLYVYIIISATAITLILIIVIIIGRMVVLRRRGSNQRTDSKPSLHMMDGASSLPSNLPDGGSDELDMAPMSITSITKDNVNSKKWYYKCKQFKTNIFK